MEKEFQCSSSVKFCNVPLHTCAVQASLGEDKEIWVLPKKHLACFFFGLISSAFEGRKKATMGGSWRRGLQDKEEVGL